MSRRLLIAIILLVLMAGGGYVWLTTALAESGDDAPLPAMPPPKAPTMASGHTDAPQWMADRIAQGIAACAGTPAPHIAADGADGRGWAATGSATAAVRCDRHAWSAEDWLPLAVAIAGSAPAEPSDEAAAWALVDELTDPTIGTLLAADRRIGGRLAAHRRDAGLWEQAALIDATLAFREAAGVLCDARPEIASACARLAWARALRPQPGPAGRVAAAIIEAIAGRAAGLEAAVAGWDGDRHLAPWARALRLRVSGDWRPTLPADATRIENLAQARALAYHISAQAMHDAMQGRRTIAGADLGRIACEANLSVQMGHVYALGALDEEFIEIATVWADLVGRSAESATPVDIIAAVNGTVTPATPRAVPAARWGAMLGRHLVNHLVRAHHFMQNDWGVPAEAAKLRQVIGGQLAGITVMCLARMQIPEDPLRVEQAAAAVRLMRTDPAWLSPGLHEVLQDAAFTAVRAPLPGPLTWWRDLAPAGTTWAACALDNLFGSRLPGRLDRIDALIARNPQDPWLRMHAVHVRGERDPAKVAAAFGDLADRDQWLCCHLAGIQQDDDGKVAVNRRLARMSPAAWMLIGKIESGRGRAAAAIEAYEHFFTDCKDRVHVANEMRWLVLWYADHGKLDRARAIAADCYETFSYRGIVTKALLDEHEGKLDDAAACYEALVERYGDQGDRDEFLLRTATLRPASAAAISAQSNAAFPGGKGAPVTLADFTGKPDAGLRVTVQSDLSAAHGLTAGCIVVALDGVRVRTLRQYDVIRKMSPGKPLDLIVWDVDAYRRITAEVPDRLLGVQYEPLTTQTDPSRM